MSKTPGGVQRPKQITKAERDAHKAFRQVDAKKAMTEQEIVEAQKLARDWRATKQPSR